MVKYIVKRCLLILPLLCLVLFSVFTLSKNFPFDPVLLSLESQGADVFSGDSNLIASERYQLEKQKLGLDLPEFYFSVVPINYIYQEGNWVVPAKISLVPKVIWHGSNCQFHAWVKQSLQFDYGVSKKDGKSAWIKTKNALGHTISYVVPAILLAFGISIWLGIYLGEHSSSIFSKVLESGLIAFNVTPLFWIATLAIIFLTTSEYGRFLNWFPRVDVSIGTSDFPIKQYVLPVIIIVIHALAYLTIQVKNIYQKQLRAPYIRAIASRGLHQGKISRKHILPNAMIPLITIFTGVLPSSLGGSVVIEEIFNIPGLGRLLYRSILQGDWNVVVPTVLLFAIITSISYLLGDMLYTIVNPRLKAAFE